MIICARRASPGCPRLLVLFGLGLGLLTLEVGPRLLGPDVPLDLTMARFQVSHPVHGFFHRPGVSGPASGAKDGQVGPKAAKMAKLFLWTPLAR